MPVSDIAEIFGVTDRSVQRMLRDGMPQAARGRYDVRACVRWKIDQITNELSSNRPSGERDLLAAAQRERVNLEVAQMRGELMPRELVERALNQIATLISGQLDSLGPRMAGELADSDDPAWVQDRLFAETRALRSAIAQSLRLLGADIRAWRMEEASVEAASF